MISDRHILDVFNHFLGLARTAKQQYEQHLTLIEHEPAQSIIADIINEEHRNIQWLATAIQDAGGKPSAHVYGISTPQDFEQMMRVDYDLEAIIIKDYELHLSEIRDPQLRALSEVLLEQARRHQEQFKGLLEDFGTDELMRHTM
jgi:rubrerythrin